MDAASLPIPGLRPFVWGRDDEAVRDAVQKTRAPFKVILKTRNEDVLLPRWLAHYRRILGAPGAIIILDNMSCSESVFNVYRQYAEEIILIRYEGNVDSAHSLKRFAPLYEAVWDSCDFYALFDTDEFLALYDGRKLVTDARILRYLEHNRGAAVFPPLFLANVFARDNAFIFEEAKIRNYHLWGKPILNAALMRDRLKTPVGHTLNLPLPLVSGKTPLPFVLLHLQQLSREQRIKANLHKLQSFGLNMFEADPHALLHAELDGPDVPPLVKLYIDDLRRLAAMTDEAEATREDMRRNHLEITPDNGILFTPESLKPLFAEHVSANRNLLDVIRTDAAKLRDMSARLEDALLPG